MRAVAVVKPLQERSVATMERILDATERLLREKVFEAITVQEVARAASVTTGAFYGRFSSKDALIGVLEQRATDTLATAVRDVLSTEHARAEDALESLLLALFDFYTAHKGVVRNLAHQSRHDPRLSRRRLDKNRELIEATIEGVIRLVGLRKARPVREALAINLLAAVAAIREAALYQNFWPADLVPGRDRLCRQLAGHVTASLPA